MWNFGSAQSRGTGVRRRFAAAGAAPRAAFRAALAWGAGLAGCGPPPAKEVSNPDPSGKIPAIKAAAERHDYSVVPQLIRDLDSNDPAVRFYASQGLRRITGQDFQYRFYESEEVRQAAIERWQHWWAGRGK